MVSAQHGNGSCHSGAFAEPSDAHDTVYPVTQVSSVSVPATNRIDIVSSTSEYAGDQTNPTSVFEPLEIAGNLIYERSEDGGETWSGWRNLGGKILGVPTITAWAPNRLDIFAIGLNYALFHMKSEDHGETWSKWEQIGGRFGSSPVAISREGRIDIIGISRNGEDMLHYWGNGNDNKWSSESLGHGRIPSASPVLNHTDFLNTHWEGKPAITSWAPDRFDIFAKGSNGVLYHKYWNGGPSWSPWLTFPYDSRGGCSTCYSSYFRIGSPAAVSWGNNRIDLFVWTDIIIPSLESGKDLYRNNVLLHTYWDGIKWRFPFEELHTTVYSEPLDIGFPNANASEPS